MTRHTIYNLCVMILHFVFAFLFWLLNMSTMIKIVTLAALILVIFPLIGLQVPEWKNWLEKRIWEE